MKRILSLLFLNINAQNRWTVSSLATVDQIVDSQTDLIWTLQSSVPLQQNDCIQISISNPYQDVTSYNSFKAPFGPTPCEIDNQQGYECRTLSETTFQIKVTSSAVQKTTLMQGQTTVQAFHNPYSTRRLIDVTVTHLPQCDATRTPLVQGKTKFPQFLPQPLNSDKITIESSNSKIGATGATLTVIMEPTSSLQEQGRILIKSPTWYQKESTKQEGVSQDYYADWMIGFDSIVTIETLSGETVTVDRADFDQSIQTLLVYYTADQTIPKTQLTLKISDFKNPVSQTQAIGFQVSTADSLGFLIEQSSSQLALSTQINQPQLFNDVQIELLGDENEENVGMISTFQKVQFSFSLIQPLEPFCYFVFEFPQTLQLGQTISNIQGTGIFQPYTDTEQLNTGQYEVDSVNNQLKVQGCRLPDSLSANPYGTLTVSFVKMPEYIQILDPVTIKVFSDTILANLVVDDPTGAQIGIDQLTPGFFAVEMFKPSNYYASATRVAYSVYVRPQHEMTPESRVIINMPDLLTFNRTEGCSVVLTICDCELHPSKNELILTNIFDTNLAGGNLIKFIILQATNPQGSRPTGPWSIRSETPVEGIFYVVDGQTYAESFFALSGTIFSELTVDNLQVSSSDTLYSFELKTEHDIPSGGKIIVTFPVETPLKTNIEVIGFPDFNHTGNSLTFGVKEAIISDTPIKFSIKNVQNVRSFQPSSKFYIATTDMNDYVIDSGGQDIIVTCSKMAYLKNVTIDNLNKTNGAVDAIKITLDLAYPILSGDTLHLEVPEEMSFGPNVTCSPEILDQNVTCTHSDRILYVSFDRVSQELGDISVIAYGIRNPPSLKPTSPFVSVFTTDQAGFQSQQLQTEMLQQLVLQTSEPALIQRYTLTQGTEEYGLDGSVTLQFYTVNPIQPDGVIIIQWSESVTFYQNTFCQVTTFKQILRADVCIFDQDTRTLRIQNAFVEMTGEFNGLVQIYLSRVKNPVTNQNLQDYKLTTYSESDLLFPVDQFTFVPKLKCLWSCQLCGTDRNYCTQCWVDKLPFLFQYNWQSTCMGECPAGWTSNGTSPAVCQQCDVSCETCQDAGRGGDVGRCLTCKPGLDFFQPVEGNTGLCLAECSTGFYDDGTGTCLPCKSSCRTCEGTPNNCTSCTLGSDLSSLYQASCIAECPIDHLDLSGVCEACESPCASCAVGSNLCTSCDGIDGLIYRFGVSCLSECPEGTKVNLKTNQCTGCKRGCLFCDIENPDLCFKCADEFILFEDTCHISCPEGSIKTFSGDSCRRLSDIDAQLVYFPFLIVTLLVAFVSWIGHKIKRAHLIFANFVIMLGFIEHLAIIVQLILSFIYGTYAFAIPMILIWLTYIATLIAFNIFWRKNVTNQDSKYRVYCIHSENQKSTKVRTFFGTFISWKFHKLLYSRFFGLHVNQFRFSHPQVVEKLMFITLMVNVAVTWAPLIILNVAGLILLQWGTQLYMIMIENVILAILCIVVGIIEHYRMLKYWKSQEILLSKSNKINKSLNKKRLKLQVYNAGLKDHSERFNFLFLTSKVDELLYVFGGRQCKSDFYDTPDKEQDDRQTYSWPLTPKKDRDDIHVDDPPVPIVTPHFDNCFTEKKQKHELKQHNGEGYNKGCQKGGMFEGDLKRAEAQIVTGQSDTETSEGFMSKRDQSKKRGRKNKYFRQIDQEDQQAGVHLDSDEDGQGFKSRAEQLAAIREEDEMRDREEQDTSVNMLIPEKQKRIGGVSIPDASFRNFNEVEILGHLDRNNKGHIITKQSESGQHFDLKNRRVSAQGYLLDDDNDIVAAQNQSVKMFQNVVNGALPAPFSFERFNFNPYQLYGNFKGFRKENDPASFQKTTDKNGILDSKSRCVNQQGFLIKDGSVVNHKGSKIFHQKQLTKDGQLQSLYTYTGTKFSIHDVMGVFKMTDTNEIIKIETKHPRGTILHKDLSGHLINRKGYLINDVGDIVNRKGKVMFEKGHLRAGEFPKIFPFSKFNMSLITGTFQVGPDGQPQLTERASGGFQDDNGAEVNEHGYLLDYYGNIVDKNDNVMFQSSLLVDGRLPGLFTSSKFLKTESDDDLSNLLHQIDGARAHNGSSYGSEMGASPTKYDKQNQRPGVNLKVQLLKSQSVGQKPIEQRSEGGSQSSRRHIKQSKQKQNHLKLVKTEKTFDSDVKMANAYGGKAEPRVRMVPKRFQTTQRDRPFAESMREGSFSQLKNVNKSIAIDQKRPSQQINNTQNQQEYVPGTRTQLENPGQIPARPSSPSNAAFSIKDRMQIRKQLKHEESDLDQELAELYQQDVDKYIDGSNFEVQSLSGFSGLSESSFMSLGRHQKEQSKTKQLETEYLSKLEKQRVLHKEQMARTSRH